MTDSAMEYREVWEQQQAKRRRDERFAAEWLAVLAQLGLIQPVKEIPNDDS